MKAETLRNSDVRKRFTWRGLECKILMGPVGCLNGYVAVPKGHPLFNRGYSTSLCGHDGCYKHTLESLIDVHGGLMYSGGSTDGALTWFGFDTAHSDDNPRFGGSRKDEAYVEAECKKLAEQLAKWDTIAFFEAVINEEQS